MLDGGAVVSEPFLRSFLGGATLEGAIGFVAGDDNKYGVAGGDDHGREKEDRTRLETRSGLRIRSDGHGPPRMLDEVKCRLVRRSEGQTVPSIR